MSDLKMTFVVAKEVDGDLTHDHLTENEEITAHFLAPKKFPNCWNSPISTPTASSLPGSIVSSVFLPRRVGRMSKPKVAFICTHNSCRSQIAEALGRHLAFDVFESYSAGSELKSSINPDANQTMRSLWHRYGGSGPAQ